MKKQVFISKVSVLISLMCVVVLFSGCGYYFTYELHHEDSMIESIEIIMIEEYLYKVDDFVEVKYETLLVISDKDTFLEDFSKVKFSMYTFGDPLSPPLVFGFDAILVKYNNGDEEYIQAEQVVLNKHGELIGGNRRSMDYKAWQALMDKYLAK